MKIALGRFAEIRDDLERMSAQNPHEMMRAAEVHSIRDCAEMAARASLFREESRWGLYHNRVDFPERNDRDWFVHVQVRKSAGDGAMECVTRPVEPYLIEPDANEKEAYNRLRIVKEPAAT
jgi:succinate dehydrogenase/fumarate reductase flavoprotein subunit